jgi:hypothetical protein
MDAELASPIETPKNAYAKLWWACYWIGIGAGDDVRPLVRRLLRVGRTIHGPRSDGAACDPRQSARTRGIVGLLGLLAAYADRATFEATGMCSGCAGRSR